MTEWDFSNLTQDELINGISIANLPDYIRTKADGEDVRETLAQMTETTIQLGVNMGLSPDDALKWARKLQESVSQSEFDSWVATLLDGGPSIFMNTLSELQTTYPNGASGVALVRETDPAKIYVWNGTIWEDFGNYQGIVVKDGTISPSKTSFAKETNPNLFRLDSVVSGVLDITNGNINQSTNYVTSNKMTVIGGETYAIPYLYVVAFFNGDTFISANNSTGANEVVAPPNANIAQLSLRKDYSGYNSYYFKLKDITNKIEISELEIGEENLKKYAVASDNLKDKSVSIEKVDFVNSGVNLFDKSAVVKGKNIQDGYLSDTPNFNVSDFINGEAGKTYTFDRFRKIATYDIDGNQKRYIDNTSNALYNLTLQIGEYSMRGSVSDALLDSVMIYEGTEARPFEPYRLSFDSKISIPTVNNVSGLKGVAFGDSITFGATYPSYISSKLNTEYTKIGFSGTRLMRNTFASPQSEVNLCNIVDAITTGDWTTLDTAVSEVGTDFTNTLATLKNINFNEIDYITIAYGANDAGTVGTYNALGDIDSDDTYTFNGAVNYVITEFLTNFPHLKLHLFTPMYRNTEGYDTKPLAEALINQHKKWSIGLLDLHHESMFNPLTINHYTRDGTHPNDIGNKTLDEKVSGYLSTH